MTSDADGLAHGIGIPKELFRYGLSDDGHLVLGALVGLGPHLPLRDVEAANLEVGRGRADDERRDVVIAVDELAWRREEGGCCGDTDRFAGDRLRVGLGE